MRSFRLSPLTLALALAGCPAGEPTEPEPEPTPEPDVAGRLVRDANISLVTVNQGVAIPLMINGEAVLDAPRVVAGRPGLLRVFVEPRDEFEPRELMAELVFRDGESVDVRRQTLDVEEASLSSDLDTTFVFAIEPERFTSATRFSVVLRDTEGVPREENRGATWPSIPEDSVVEISEDLNDAYDVGQTDLRVSDWGGVVRIYIVPVRYDTDGSGRLPDTSPEQLEVLRSWMMRLFPLREVILEVGEPYPTTLSFDSTSEPMSDLLEEMIDVRGQRGIPFDTYLYAMVNPAESRAGYCAGGCTAGSADRVRNPNTSWLRAGVGLGYSGQSAAETMAHEVGHNHDRGHAPCGGAGNIDEAYPYANGGTGVWGWDIIDEVLVNPADHADVMGYCTPLWISDYQFDALFARAAAVEGLASWEGGLAGRWQVLSLRPGERSRLRGTLSLPVPPDGEVRYVRLLDSTGAELRKVEATEQPIADAAQGVATLLLPPLSDDVAAVLLPDGRVVDR